MIPSPAHMNGMVRLRPSRIGAIVGGVARMVDAFGVMGDGETMMVLRIGRKALRTKAKFPVWPVLVASILMASSGLGQPVQFLTIDPTNNRLLLIRATSTPPWNVIAIGNLGLTVHDADLCDLNGVLYCVDSDYSAQRARLLTIDPQTGHATFIADLFEGSSTRVALAESLAASGGQLYVGYTTTGSSTTSTKLGVLSLDGHINTFTSLQIDLDGMTADESGQLYAMDGEPASEYARLYTVSLSGASQVGSQYSTPDGVVDIAFAGSDLYGVPYDNNRLHRLDPATGDLLDYVQLESALSTQMGGLVAAVGQLCPGRAVIGSQPHPATTCSSGSVTFSVNASGTAPTYQWQVRNSDTWANLADGPAAPIGASYSGNAQGTHTNQFTVGSLTRIAGGPPTNQVQFRCIVSNACGSATSNPATLTVCAADIDCDGTVDFFDYDSFVVAFEAGAPRADFDVDGTIDFFDYDAFVVVFEAGC